jgi:hypothetical protein
MKSQQAKVSGRNHNNRYVHLATFSGKDLIEMRELLKVETRRVPWPSNEHPLFRISLHSGEVELAVLDIYTNAIYLRGWSCKGELKSAGELFAWLNSRDVTLPASRLLPEWEAIREQLYPGISEEKILHLLAEAKEEVDSSSLDES